MILTRTKIYRLPRHIEDAHPSLMIPTRTYEEGPIEELLAYLAGEQITPSLILMGPRLPFIDYDMSLEPFPIICSDGTLLKYALGTLVRNFHFFDDFMTQFPDAKSVTVPHKKDDVVRALGSLDNCSVPLCHVIDIVHFLNPKDSLYYFRFSMKSMDLDVLKSLTINLTEQNRFDILSSRRERGIPYPVPREGLGWHILAPILEMESDCYDPLLVECFSHCPSYLLSGYLGDALENDYNECLRTLLTTADFRDDDSGVISESYGMELVDTLTAILQRMLCLCDLTWDEQKRLLSMLGLESGVVGLRRINGPYRLPLLIPSWSEETKDLIVCHAEKVCSDEAILIELEAIL